MQEWKGKHDGQDREESAREKSAGQKSEDRQSQVMQGVHLPVNRRQMHFKKIIFLQYIYAGLRIQMQTLPKGFRGTCCFG